MSGRRLAVALALVAAAGLLAGCSTTMGKFVPNSQFAYPNSNVTVLGPVSASASKGAWIVAPSLSIEDVKGVYNQALAQAEGANILVNYKENTVFTSYSIIPYSRIEYRIEGQAARMEVGQQHLE